MDKNLRFRSAVLYSIAGLIIVLLIINILLIYRNSQAIETHKRVQEEAEGAKINTLDIIRNLHLLDIGLRGYALVQNRALLAPMDSAKNNRGRIFPSLESTLRKQSYPNMEEYQALRDTVNAYFDRVDAMVALVNAGRMEDFLRMLDDDHGYTVWLQFKRFSLHVNQFEDEIVEKAKQDYGRALQNSYLLQLLIFLLSAPALIYMAIYASRTFRFSEQLRVLQLERNQTLKEQNEELDKLVKEKTRDILAQNEEIRAHNDQLLLQQEEIQRARTMIETQSKIIEKKNSELSAEVEKQTIHLRSTNVELVEQNNRLEQFAYIISHNLRAPLARLQGLASVLHASRDTEEKEKVLRLMVQSSHEFDTVISDLSSILSIQKSNTNIRSTIHLEEMIRKVLAGLEEEVQLINATLEIRMDGFEVIQSLPPYVESIFYNLITNAIKYRNPERPLNLRIRAERIPNYLCVHISDNGLGIDLQKHGDKLFNLYKRFHLHVEGKGLGLYLVKTQMEALGGKIEVDSVVDEGTTFRLYFEASGAR